MINTHDILETINMIQDENLDIRTITMGISLLDCCDSDIDRSCEKIYRKITEKAGRLVAVGQEIEETYGIPIINKRISVTPIAIAAESCETEDYTIFAQAMDKAAKECGVKIATENMWNWDNNKNRLERVGFYISRIPRGMRQICPLLRRYNPLDTPPPERMLSNGRKDSRSAAAGRTR